MWIVVICKQENMGAFIAHPCAFTGDSRDKLVAKALKKRDEMYRQSGYGGQTYEIYLGQLTHMVDYPAPRFELIKLTEPNEPTTNS